jgi:DNA-binding NarL/FixJ family response regulator
MPHRVLIASDIRLYREGLANALASRGSLAVVGTTSSPAETLARLLELRRDALLQDMAMPDSLAVIRAAAEENPELRIIALSVGESDGDVLACVESGIAGYVTRGGSLDDLVQTLESAARGELQCSPRIAAALLKRLAVLAAGRAANPGATLLTARERQIVSLIDEGLSNKEIARRLGVEVATVKNHVHNVLEKLHVTRRSAAAACVREQHGVRLPPGSGLTRGEPGLVG